MSNVNCLQDNIQIKNYICKILMLICQRILQHGDTEAALMLLDLQRPLITGEMPSNHMN